MKIYSGFFVDQSKRLMALGVIVLILLTSAFGVVSGDEPEENKELLDCLCSCLEPPGGQFSCCYNTEDRGWSPSCRDLSNGPCICKAYGCFRGPLPTEGECYDNCYAKYAQEKPEAEEGEEKPLKRFIDRERLEEFLRSQGYDESACPKEGDPPTGSVKFWSVVPGGGIAHSSVMLSNNRQIEMGHKKPGGNYETPYELLGPGEKYVSAILPKGRNPLTVRNVEFTPYYRFPMLCPPPTYHFDNDCIENMEGTDREFGTSKKWNCHGFSARVVHNCVETDIRMKPITDFDWKGKTLILNGGEVWGDVIPLTIQIPQGAVQFGSEYTIEVRNDNTTIIYLIKGKADYKGTGHSLSLSSGQMGVIDPTGVPSAPTTFDVHEMDQWWKKVEPSPETSQEKEGLTFESRSNPSGNSVQIPLTLSGIEDKIGNMDITLSYDPSVLEATEVTKGDLTSDSLFEYNMMAGTIRISLADAEGFSGNGSIAYVTFNVTGAADSTSPLQIAALGANRADDYEALTIPTNDGVFKVESGLTVSVSDTTGAKGSTVEVPINLEGASEVGSMDIILTYDADVLSAEDVEAGALGKNALIESNTARDGEVIIALADSSGINGDGAVASVAFEVIGDAGTTSALTLEEVLVYNLDLAEIIPNTVNGTFEVGVQEPSLDELPEFIFGNLETFDFDNDGSDDKYVYTFERQEVAPNLFLDKSIEVEKAPSGSGYSKELILRFENTGDGTVEYQHIEYIPKSFAESVNDLEFSRPPDRIIEEDPVLEWFISLPGKAIEVVTSCLPIFNFYPMDVDTFAAMSQTEKCDWIKKQIGPHINTIDKTAKKHNIPPWLLATVILNELADYDFKDQFQELIFSRGSVGMAQITARTAQRHNLVDITEEDITKSLETPETLPVKPQEDPFQSVGPMQPGEAEFSLEEYLQLKRECAIDHITWERLNQPEYAIEGAAREIEYIINNVNQNLDKTWPKSLLNGSIDRNDLYANIKMQIPNEKDPDERRILRKEGLALLVIAAYNTDTIPESNFELSSPYHKREKGQNFFDAINHANNGVDLFVRLLEDCGHFVEEEEEEEDTSDGEFYCPIPIPNEASHFVEDYSEYWLTPNGFVGPYYYWHDTEKTKKCLFTCYNIEGELHGVCKSWYEDGTLRGDWNYKDGKGHGVCKEWYEEGTPMYEWNYKDGKLHGVCKEWSYKGTLIRECNYEEGKCVSCVHGHC